MFWCKLVSDFNNRRDYGAFDFNGRQMIVILRLNRRPFDRTVNRHAEILCSIAN